MNINFNILCFFIFVMLMAIMPGCVDLNSLDKNSDSLLGEIPEHFDWKMVNEISCTIKVASISSISDSRIHIIQIYKNNLLIDSSLIASGAATPSKPFIVKISLAKTVQTIYVREILPGGTTALKTIDVTGNTLDVDFSSSVSSSAPVLPRSAIDNDGDGIAAELDVDDNDSNVAFVSYFPDANTWGTFLFEDLWPDKGDYDVNDMVLGFKISYFTNASNMVTNLRLDYNLRAAGCTYNLGAAFQLDNVSASNVASVSGQELCGTSLFAVVSNGTESGISLAVVPLFNNQKDVVSYSGFLNTESGTNVITPDKFVKIKFAIPMQQSDITMSTFNLFIVANERGREIHLPTFEGTTKFKPSLASGYNLYSGDKFKSNDGMMWGLMFPEYFEYPSETNSITKAYLHFSEWANSGGSNFSDWYKSKDGYTNRVFIYSALNSENPVDYDGNVYHSIKIGTQTWMVENLKTTKYNDGTNIPNVTDATTWINLTSPGYCWYDNLISNKNLYGALYNWYALNTGKLAPIGWHVPTDAEWTTLNNYLINHGYGYGGSGNGIGKAMASSSGWALSAFEGTIGNNQSTNNSSGFTGVPAGLAYYNGAFYGIENICYWWSSSEFDNTKARARFLNAGTLLSEC